MSPSTSTLQLFSALLPLVLAKPLPQQSLPEGCQISDYGPQQFEFVKPKEASLLGNLLGGDSPDISAFGTVFTGFYGIDQATLPGAGVNATKNIALLATSATNSSSTTSSDTTSYPGFATDAKDPSIRSFNLRSIDFACFAYLGLTGSVLGESVACSVEVACDGVTATSDGSPVADQTFSYGGTDGGSGDGPAERVGRMTFDQSKFSDLTGCDLVVTESEALLGTALLVDNVDYTLTLCEVAS